MRAPLVAAAIVLGAALASAQGDVGEARAFFNAGAQAYAAGDFLGAAQAFREAYRRTPRAGLLFSLGQAYRKQWAIDRNPAHLGLAIESYEKYVAEAKQGDRAAEASQALAELRPIAASETAEPGAPAPMAIEAATRIYVSSPTRGAALSIDGKPAGALPYGAKLEPGKHRIVISARGYQSHEREIDVPKGAFVPVDQRLDDLPARIAVEAPEGSSVAIDGRPVGNAPLAPLELPPGEHFVAITQNGRRAFTRELTLDRGERAALRADLDATGQRTLAWVLMCAGGVGLATGGALGLVALGRQSNAQELLDRRKEEALSAGERAEYDSLRTERDRLRSAAAFTAVGGFVVGATGFVLYLFDEPRVVPPSLEREKQKEDAPATQPEAPAMEISTSPFVGPGSAGLAAHGTF